MLFRALIGPDRAIGAMFLTVATAVAPLVGLLALVFSWLVLTEHRESAAG